MAGAEADNAGVMAGLRRRQSRLAAVFYGGLVAIPLGVICPCGLAAVVYQVAPEWSQDVALSSFLLPLVGLAAVLLVMGGRSRARRSIALCRLADSLKLRFEDAPEKDQFNFLAVFPVLNALRVPYSGEGANLLEGTYRRRPLTAVDYTTLHLLGYQHFVRRRTAAVFTAGFERLPSFAVVPQTWADKFEQAVLGPTAPGKKVAVPDEKEFNRHFAVLTEANRAALVACLTPAVIDAFLEDKNLSLEVYDGMMVVHRRQTVVAAAEYEEFLRTASRIAQALPSEPEA